MAHRYPVLRIIAESLRKHHMQKSAARKFFFLSLITGITAAIGVILFHVTLKHSINFFNKLVDRLPYFWLIIFIPALGGLLSGLVRYFSRENFDSPCATDTMIDAIKENNNIRPKSPAATIVAASLTIASGGSCGRECPTAYIGAGCGAVAYKIIHLLRLDRLLKIHFTNRDRRLMGIAGAAAGLGAIFQAPIGGALFATEVLYEYGLEFSSLLPALLASIVSYMIFTHFYSPAVLFTLNNQWTLGPNDLLFAFLAGICSAALGWLYIKFFYYIYSRSRASRFPDYLKPAVGGLFHGIAILLISKELWGMGYGTIQKAIDGQLAVSVLLVLVVGKIISTSFSIGSGGSGGIIAPTLYIGAMMGGALGKIFASVTGTSTPQSIYVIIGMGSLYAAVGKVPIALPIMLMETTQSYGLILPLFIASVIGYVLSGPYKIYESQIPILNRHPHGLNILGETEMDLLESHHIEPVVLNEVIYIPEDFSYSQVVEIFRDSSHIFFPVLDREGRYAGYITLNHLRSCLLRGDSLDHLILAKDICTNGLPPLMPGDSLRKALEAFQQKKTKYLPVVENRETMRFIGLLDQRDVLEKLKTILLEETGTREEEIDHITTLYSWPTAGSKA